MGERFIVDISSMYVGIEHYYEYDDAGRILEKKSIHPYIKVKEMKGDKHSRAFYYNFETGDQMKVDQDGNVIDTDSEYRDIISLTNLSSFYDITTELLDNKDRVSDKMEFGDESMDFVKTLNDLMDKCSNEGVPALIDFTDQEFTFDQLIKNLSGLYIIAYDNPLQNEGKVKCLYRIHQGGNKK